MGNSNSEGTCQQNDCMAKDHYGLTKDHGDINGKAQP